MTKSDALNAGQKAASQDILDFLLSVRQFHLLSGPAGSGKTFLLDAVCTDVLPKARGITQLFQLDHTPAGKIAPCAPTHKAAAVLGHAMKTYAPTVHSLLGLRLIRDGSGGYAYDQPEKPDLRDALLIVDEYSMVSTELLKYLLDTMHPTTKVLFVGDHCQLPPVGEDQSPILSLPDMQMSFLTEQGRNSASPALQKLCESLRQHVDTKQVFDEIIPQTSGQVVHLSPQEAVDFFYERFAAPNLKTRVLAFTNKSVEDYLADIRHVRGTQDTYIPGEPYSNRRAVFKGRTLLMPTDAEVVLKDIQPCAPLQVTPDLSLPVHTATANVSGAASVSFPVPVDPSEYETLLKTLKRRREFDALYTLQEKVAVLRPSSCMTIHKSQGSSFDDVFIDLTDIDLSRNFHFTLRLLYVAVSRARGCVYFYSGAE
jgi:hypothetical protein